MRVALSLIALLCAMWLGAGSEHRAAAQSPDNLDALSEEISRLGNAGKRSEAASLAERLISLVREQLGDNSREYARAITQLGWVYEIQGRVAEAEPLFKQGLAILELHLPAGHWELADRLEYLGNFLLNQGRYEEGETLLKRVLETRESSASPDLRAISHTLTSLAAASIDTGRSAEAILLLKRALLMREQVLPENHADIATSAYLLGYFYGLAGRDAESGPYYVRALAIREKTLAPNHPLIIATLHSLGSSYLTQDRPQEAEPVLKRALAMREKTLRANHPDIGFSLHQMGALYNQLRTFAQAEEVLKRAVEIFENNRKDNELAEALSHLAMTYSGQERIDEAERLMKRAIEIRDRVLPADHPDMALSLNGLGIMYQSQGRLAEAEGLLKRAHETNIKSFSAGHLRIAFSGSNLAYLYVQQRRPAEAEPLLKSALETRQKELPADHLGIAKSFIDLGACYQIQKRLSDAASSYEQALAIHERALPKDHPALIESLGNLGMVYQSQGRLDEADALMKRSHAIIEQKFSEKSFFGYMSLAGLSSLALSRQEPAAALAYAQRATARLIEAGNRGKVELPSAGKGPAADNSDVFRLHVLAAYRNGDSTLLRDEAFRIAQWAERTSASAALVQMAARQSKNDDALSRLVRELQDLQSQLPVMDTMLSAALARADTGQATALREQIANLEVRWRAADQQISSEFADYAALSAPKPLSISEAQSLLRPDEAILLYTEASDDLVSQVRTHGFVWIITNTEAHWHKLAISPAQVASIVGALRCGLDHSTWQNPESRLICAQTLGASPATEVVRVNGKNDSVERLPFDLRRAHTLYKALIGNATQLIHGKHLLVVPSGALTSLPLHVLVAEPPGNALPRRFAEYRTPAWFGLRQPITVLPSVASLKALREGVKISKATLPYIGFGNPLLTGPSGADKRAWAKQSCVDALPSRTRIAGRNAPGTLSRYFRGNLADIELVRRQAPLPETTDELCAVARSVGASPTSVYLGEKATETTIKGLSTSGSLGLSRVVHFATHGLLARESGELGASKAEPALILTPPDDASDTDDGLLTASEVAQLKLDADWVILSACNTAAGGDALNSEALSGLARAFFYAGARALLVSHWAVDSQATVELVTKSFRAIAADRSLGRAEALRRSMRALVASGGVNTHPAYWAPFVVVGEGGARLMP